MTSSDTTSQIAYLARILKAPALLESAGRLAERARADGWTHQEYLAACLEAEAATRSAHGAANRIRAAGFPARKTIELSGVRTNICRVLAVHDVHDGVRSVVRQC